jgi:hypothetical protein
MRIHPRTMTSPIQVVLVGREAEGEENLGVRYVGAAVAAAGHRVEILPLNRLDEIPALGRRLIAVAEGACDRIWADRASHAGDCNPGDAAVTLAPRNELPETRVESLLKLRSYASHHEELRLPLPRVPQAEEPTGAILAHRAHGRTARCGRPTSSLAVLAHAPGCVRCARPGGGTRCRLRFRHPGL